MKTSSLLYVLPAPLADTLTSLPREQRSMVFTVGLNLFWSLVQMDSGEEVTVVQKHRHPALSVRRLIRPSVANSDASPVSTRISVNLSDPAAKRLARLSIQNRSHLLSVMLHLISGFRALPRSHKEIRRVARELQQTADQALAELWLYMDEATAQSEEELCGAIQTNVTEEQWAQNDIDVVMDGWDVYRTPAHQRLEDQVSISTSRQVADMAEERLDPDLECDSFFAIYLELEEIAVRARRVQVAQTRSLRY